MEGEQWKVNSVQTSNSPSNLVETLLLMYCSLFLIANILYNFQSIICCLILQSTVCVMWKEIPTPHLDLSITYVFSNYRLIFIFDFLSQACFDFNNPSTSPSIDSHSCSYLKSPESTLNQSSSLLIKIRTNTKANNHLFLKNHDG